jgi:hypothetical protein
MRIPLLVAAALLMAACSEAPKTETKAPEPEPPLTPLTGRQAFQATFAAARAWAPDCQPLRIRSMNLAGVKAGDGTAGAWEIVYVSMSRAAAKVYTWSAIEAEGNLHKGVFAGQQQSWNSSGQERPFAPAAIRIDTNEALKTASKDNEYLKQPGKKPPVTFLLEQTPRFPDAAWRVLWGESVGSAEHQVFVDASTGAVLGKQ